MSSAAARLMRRATRCPAMRPTHGSGEWRKRPNGVRESMLRVGRRTLGQVARAQITVPLLVGTTDRTSGSWSPTERRNQFAGQLRFQLVAVLFVGKRDDHFPAEHIRSKARHQNSSTRARRRGPRKGRRPEEPMPTERAHLQLGVVDVAALGDDQAEVPGGTAVRRSWGISAKS